MTLGQEAIDLCAAAGQVLDPWQCDVVRDILAVQDDGRWAAFETCTIAQRQQGKGGIIEAIELAGLFLFGEMLILHSAHEYKTAQEAFLRIKAMVDGCADLTRYVKAIREANGEQQIILMSGARLRFVARSKGSGRGFSGQRNILDEAYALTLTQLAALLPTMSAQPNPQLNQFSTVPDPDTMPEPDEAVLPAVHQRALEAQRTGDPGGLTYHDWSMQPGEDPNDPEVWYACNPALGIRIAEDYVRAELAALGSAKFSTERLGLWPDEAGVQWSVISEAEWTDAGDEESSALDPVVFTVEVSKERNLSCIATVGARSDGALHGEIVEYRPGTDWVVARLVELVLAWKPCAVSLVGTGAAFTLYPALTKALAEAGSDLEVKVMTNREVASAYGMTVDAVKAKASQRLWWRPNQHGAVLTAAVRGGGKRDVGEEGTAWSQAASSVDISALKALTNAVHTFVSTELPPPAPATASSVPESRGGNAFFRPTGRLKI